MGASCRDDVGGRVANAFLVEVAEVVFVKRPLEDAQWVDELGFFLHEVVGCTHVNRERADG